MGENKEVQEMAHEHDAEKGESGDSGKQTAAAGHDARNDAQDLAAQGDEDAKRISKDWGRDRSKK